jgi:hypothetical protein
MFRYFRYTNTLKYIDILQDIIDSYNYTVHSRTKIAPLLVNEANEKEVFNNLYKNQTTQIERPKFLISDLVRITKLKKLFEKGYSTNWTDELFKISKIIHTSPYPKYKIEDLKGNEIIGSFYKNELQKTD